MKWITREKVKVDRVACPWLIRRLVDREAEFLFVPAEGFRHLGLVDDHAVIAAESVVSDALYACCREMVRQGRVPGAFTK